MADPREPGTSEQGTDGRPEGRRSETGFLLLMLGLGFLPAALLVAIMALSSKGAFDGKFHLGPGGSGESPFSMVLLGTPVFLFFWSLGLLLRYGVGPLALILGSLLAGAIMTVANIALAAAGCSLLS
jgi:hypothetical protein